MFTRPVPAMSDEGDVQAFTGYFSPSYTGRQWDRGALYRFPTFPVTMTPDWPMFDPSDPAQYNQALSP